MLKSNVPNHKPIPWAQLIAAQQKSGLTQKAFCTQHQLPYDQFTYYRSRLTKSASPPPVSDFAKVNIPSAPESAATSIRFILPNGWQCEIPVALPMSQWKAIIEALSHAAT